MYGAAPRYLREHALKSTCRLCRSNISSNCLSSPAFSVDALLLPECCCCRSPRHLPSLSASTLLPTAPPHTALFNADLQTQTAACLSARVAFEGCFILARPSSVCVCIQASALSSILKHCDVVDRSKAAFLLAATYKKAKLALN